MDQVIFGENVFLRRIPILNRQSNICAYQVDFIHLNNSLLEEVAFDSSISTALNTIDPSKLCGKKPVIFKTDPDALDTLALNEKWKERVIMEIPTLSLPVQGNGQNNPVNLKKPVFCLSGYVPSKKTIPELPSSWYVKIDTSENENELARTVKALEGSGAITIATSVNTPVDFDMCKRVGINHFIGDFYSQPIHSEKKDVSPNQALLLELSAQTTGNGDIRNIENIVKKNPDLTYGLMNLIHSAYFSVPEHVASIRQAIALLGFDNLHKWVSLMLFSIGQTDVSLSPLFEKALTRARTMELSVVGHRTKGLGSTAYIVGVFSVVPALFNVDLKDILDKANFVDEIKGALLERSGTVGSLLNCVEAIDNAQYDSPCLLNNNGFGATDILRAHTTALLEKNLTESSHNQTSVNTSVTANVHVTNGKTYDPLPGPQINKDQRSWIAKFLSFLGLRNKKRPNTKRCSYALL